jgi:Asp-tRNA(Asn)/Glu-tRNA(Gln) amidotransferase A subunit family amidase
MDADPRETVERHAARLGFDLSHAELDAFADALASLEAAVDPLDSVALEDPPSRDSWKPDDEADPNGAFLTGCDVSRTDEGSLAGTTVAVKDNVAVAGVELTCGSPAFSGYEPVEDATVVDRLLDAGAAVVGKTTLDAFAYARQPNALPFRTPRNPHDNEFQPGSSSSGSAIAVADELADVALGTDNGGSVRIPAAWCGVVGLKPSRGLVSHHGVVLSAKTFDTVGVLAPETRAVARTLAAIAGPDRRDDATAAATVDDYEAAVDRGHDDSAAAPTDLVVGVPDAFVGTAPERDAVARAALDDLADAGATVREVGLPEADLVRPTYAAINAAEIGNYLRASATTYWHESVPDPTFADALHAVAAADPDSLPMHARRAQVLAAALEADGNRAYALAQRARDRIERGLESVFATVDVLASVTVAADPVAVGDPLPEAVATNTLLANVAGLPAITVPCGYHDGLPVGLQFFGPRGGDATVLEAAARWEHCRDAP